MSGKSYFNLFLVASIALCSCSTGKNITSNDSNLQEFTDDLPDSIISFYPSFGQYSDYNPSTQSYPNCVLDKCGKPISFITKDNQLLSINTVGTSYPSYQLSPSKDSILIQDNFGSHVISKDGYTYSKNDPAFYQDRGGAILDDGEAVAVSHLGSIEVDSKSGFGSQISNFKDKKVSNYRQIIDGDLIQRLNNVYLISYGDEDINHPINTSYRYSWNKNKFVKLDLPNTTSNSSLIKTNCIDENSFNYIRTDSGKYFYGIWSSSTGFNDLSETTVEPIRKPNGTQYSVILENGFYYINNEANVYFSDLKSNKNNIIYNLKDLDLELNMNKPWNISVFDQYILIIGFSKHNSGHYAGTLVELKTNRVLMSKYISKLNSVYKDEEINDVRVSDPDAVLEWLASLPDNKP